VLIGGAVGLASGISEGRAIAGHVIAEDFPFWACKKRNPTWK
jgi:hypothetical protein